jgi:hypothetical protein
MLQLSGDRACCGGVQEPVSLSSLQKGRSPVAFLSAGSRILGSFHISHAPLPLRDVAGYRPCSASTDATCSGGSRSTGRLGTPQAVCAPPLSALEDGRRHDDETPWPPPPLSPSSFLVGHPSRRPKREICVIPRMEQIDEVEALLSSRALVAMVARARRMVPSDQVNRLL